MKRHIPNFITSLNLIAGCISIVMALNNDLQSAAYLIILAAVFDFFDGMAARILKVKSAIGKELDSLADVVSFGVAPACIMYMLMRHSTNEPGIDYKAFLSFILVVFSALRLAKFNIDESQEDSFIGLPTPANALFIASLSFILPYQSCEWMFSFPSLALITLVLSYLLVSPLPLFSFKFKNMLWKGNEYRYLLIVFSVVLFVFFKLSSISYIIILYMILSVVSNLFEKRK